MLRSKRKNGVKVSKAKEPILVVAKRTRGKWIGKIRIKRAGIWDKQMKTKKES